MEKATTAGVTGQASLYAPGFNPFVPEYEMKKPAVSEDEKKNPAAAAAVPEDAKQAAAENPSLDYCFDNGDDEEMANHEIDLTPSKPEGEAKTAELPAKDHEGEVVDDLD